MADEPGPEPALARTDRLPQDIATSFSSRFPDFRCVVCDDENFEILSGDGDDYLSSYEVHDRSGGRQASSIATIGIACTNCGHIHQFSLDILRRRLLGG